MNNTVHFGALQLPSKPIFDAYITADKENSLEGLGVVNLFVGPNNSGKSRFLRNLFRTHDLHYVTDKYEVATFQGFLERFVLGFHDAVLGQMSSIGNLTIDTLRVLQAKMTKSGSRFIAPNWDLPKELGEWVEVLKASDGPGGTHPPPHLLAKVHALRQRVCDEYNSIPWDPGILSRKRFYVPILRGMRPFKADQRDFYHDRTESDYFKEKLLLKDTIFTGLGLYSILKSYLLGQPEEREAVRLFQDFLSRRFFESRPVTLIPLDRDDIVHIQIGREKQFPIYDLGDGLQNLIILMFHVFLEKEPCLFFMEEPETCMHPGFQRVLLQEITRLDHHQYFITTHSNHLLDMTIDFSDVSVYLFKKEADGETAKFSIEPRSSKDHALLRSLGVCNSSVFLSNATIWVEGVTDRLYLRAFMNKYLKCLKEERSADVDRFMQFREDCHYSFVEYQGSNVEHWAFDSGDNTDERMHAVPLCARAFVVADGDIVNKGDREGRLKKTLGDRLEILPCKEIENLIPEEVVRKIVAEDFKKRGKDVASVKYKGYSASTRGIGKYLDHILEDSVYGAPSGTLRNKMGFCEKAIALMGSKDFQWQLPDPLRLLCSRIFSHIAECNPEPRKGDQGA